MCPPMIAALLAVCCKFIVALLAAPRLQNRVVCRWLAGACALDLAAQVDFPPCLVLRQMLKHLPLSLSKQVPLTVPLTSALFRSPSSNPRHAWQHISTLQTIL